MEKVEDLLNALILKFHGKPSKTLLNICLKLLNSKLFRQKKSIKPFGDEKVDQLFAKVKIKNAENMKVFLQLMSRNKENFEHPNLIYGNYKDLVDPQPKNGISKPSLNDSVVPEVHKDYKSGKPGGMVTAQSVASVFDAYYAPTVSSSTPVSEDDLIRDLLFVFQGINGAFLTFTDNNYTLRKDIIIPNPTREIFSKLCQLGWVYTQISNLLEDEGAGLVTQALKATVEGEMKEYRRLLCILEQNVDKDMSNKGFCSHELSLKRLFVWSRGPLFRLSILLQLLNLTKDRRGGEVLNAVHGYNNHGDRVLKDYTTRLIKDIAKPFMKMVAEWIEKGELVDPYGEFFVRLGEGSNLWIDGYSFVKEMVPDFIGLQLANKIYLIGKSLNFLKLLGRPVVLPHQTLDFNNFQVLQISIDNLYKQISTKLLDTLFQDYNLISHLDNLKRFVVLGQGDFVSYLIDALGEILDQPAKTIYRHNLTSVLSSAISQTCVPLTGDCLDVKLMEVSGGETGWEVFMLDYKVESPLDTVLTIPSMSIYQRLFTFMWRLKRVDQILVEGYKKPRTHKVLLLRQEMRHFVNMVTNHCFEAVEAGWTLLMTQCQNSKDLDEVIESHRLFLVGLMKNVMFASGDQQILVLILSVLTTIVGFERSKSNDDWVVAEASKGFRERVEKLVVALREVGSPLATRLDFNEVYSR